MSEKSIESNGMNNGSNRKNGNVRESFNSQWGFILACIGSAVGMGNIWMFSTRVSLYGGGAFLIPYIIFVVLIGATGVIGEMSLGRAARSGPIDAFGMICEKKRKEKAGRSSWNDSRTWFACDGNRLYCSYGLDFKICSRNFYRSNPRTRECRRFRWAFWQYGICVWKQCMAGYRVSCLYGDFDVWRGKRN